MCVFMCFFLPICATLFPFLGHLMRLKLTSFDGKVKVPMVSPWCRCPCGTTWAQGRALAFQTAGGPGSSNWLGITEAKGSDAGYWRYGDSGGRRVQRWHGAFSKDIERLKSRNRQILWNWSAECSFFVFLGFKFKQIPPDGPHGPVTNSDGFGLENLTAAWDRKSCCWSHVQTNFQRTLLEMKWASLSTTLINKNSRDTVSHICQLFLDVKI